LRNSLTGHTKHYAAATTVLLALTGLSGSALAFQPLITDDTGTQGSGGNQLEFSFIEDRAETAGEIERVRTLPVVYTRGLSDALDVFAGLSHVRVRPAAPESDVNGNGNPSVGAKWRFYEDEASRTSFALKPEILLPVSAERESAGLGTGKTSANLTLILTQEVPFGAVHLNAGVGRERFRDTAVNPDVRITRVSFAPVWDIDEQWKIALDVGTESARTVGATVRANFVELGVIWAQSKNLDFALGLVRASDDGSPGTTTHTANAGITWRFR
jgi:hypothetical protein